MPGSKNAEALAIIWDLPNQGGPTGSGSAQVVGTDDKTRYDRWDWQSLHDVGLASKISSVSVYGPSSGATTLILYSYGDYVHSYQNATRFWGDFLLIDNRGSGSAFDLNLATRPIMSGDWENCPTSLIVAHTALRTEFRVSANKTLTPIWNKLLDEQLQNAEGKARRSGDPSWAWEAFPKGLEHLNPEQNYLRVTQELVVSPPGPITDYSASITYWLRLVAQAGRVNGWVARWQYHVESGLFSELIGAIVKPYAMLGAEQLNDQLASGILPLPPSVSVSDIYFLPGTQTDLTKPGEWQIFQGHSAQDATVVLQL